MLVPDCVNKRYVIPAKPALRARAGIQEVPDSRCRLSPVTRHIASARFPNLKPTTQAISLRLPAHMLERIKAAANKRNTVIQLSVLSPFDACCSP